MQMVNLIPYDQHGKLFEEHMSKEDDYANWIQWALVKKEEHLQWNTLSIPHFNPIRCCLNKSKKVKHLV